MTDREIEFVISEFNLKEKSHRDRKWLLVAAKERKRKNYLKDRA